jgi:hypothetical protein
MPAVPGEPPARARAQNCVLRAQDAAEPSPQTRQNREPRLPSAPRPRTAIIVRHASAEATEQRASATPYLAVKGCGPRLLAAGNPQQQTPGGIDVPHRGHERTWLTPESFLRLFPAAAQL